MRHLSWILWTPLFASACSRSVDVAVQLVDPCNQNAVMMVDYLKIVPRGTGIVSDDYTSTWGVSRGSAPAIKIPLVPDFQLVATGHKMSPDAAASAIGISAKKDLSNAKQRVTIKVPFALVDAFYKTTSLDQPQTCSTLSASRYGATATYLPDIQKVLIVGGATLMNNDLSYTRLVEIYDPATGAFTQPAELPAGGARAFHTATLLSDGRVLIAGGEALVMLARTTLKSALIIDAHDPNNIKISDGIAMHAAREGHTAALLANGKVVLIGGRVVQPGMPDQYLSAVEVFDPDKGLFTFPVDASGMNVSLSAARYAHSATLLKSGTDIFVAGGVNDSGPVLTPEVLRMGQSAASVVTSQDNLGVGPIAHAAGLFDNAVLLSGGYMTQNDALPATGLPQKPSSNVEMWQFKDTGEFTKICATSLSTGRGFHTLTTMGRRAIFIGGRGQDGTPLANGEIAEILGAGSGCFAQPPSVNPMTDARTEHAVASLPTGEILVVGGRQQTSGDPFGRSIDSAEIYSPAREP